MRVAERLRRWTQIELAVPLLLTVCLVTASTFASTLVRGERELTAFDGHLVLTVPAGWTAEEIEGVLTVVAPTFGPSARVEARVIELSDDPIALDLFLARLAEQRASEGIGYRVLDGSESVLGSVRGEQTHYALVREPDDGTSVPIVFRGVDVIAPLAGTNWVHLHVAAPSVEGSLDPRLAEVLMGVEVRP